MHNKKTIWFVVIVFLLVIVPFFNNRYSSKTQNNSEDLTIVSMFDVDTLYDYSDPKVIEEHVDYIAIIKIESIDGVSNKDIISDDYSIPYTYGKAKVLEVLKGSILKDNITYARSGGTMAFNEWLAGEDNPEKIINILNKNSSIDYSNVFVDTLFKDDIKIEKDKVYLAYMEKVASKNFDFSIIGFQNGLRELKYDKASNMEYATNAALVKNNNTKVWEKISSVVSY